MKLIKYMRLQKLTNFMTQEDPSPGLHKLQTVAEGEPTITDLPVSWTETSRDVVIRTRASLFPNAIAVKSLTLF